jgi:putative ABC transport system permease protein
VAPFGAIILHLIGRFMLKHYFEVSLRHLWKGKWYTAVNVGGLAIALASFIIILIYLNYELSYDR